MNIQDSSLYSPINKSKIYAHQFIKQCHTDELLPMMSHLDEDNNYRRLRDDEYGPELIKKFKNTLNFVPETLPSFQRIAYGSIMITEESVANEITSKFNSQIKIDMENGTYEHKTLCNRSEEIAGLIFLTFEDLIGPDLIDCEDLPKYSVLCDIIENNIKTKIINEFPWLIKYSNYINKEYYGFSADKLKIKMNYMLDDASMGCEDGKGGLFLSGLLSELEVYSNTIAYQNNKKFGMISQILIPSGLPEKRKWSQIDVGITLVGKRRLNEDILVGLQRDCMNKLHFKVHDDVLNKGNMNHPSNKYYYGGLKNGVGFEGHEIHVWEILYLDQIEYVECANSKGSSSNFCRCKIRGEIISRNLNKVGTNHNKSNLKNSGKTTYKAKNKKNVTINV